MGGGNPFPKNLYPDHNPAEARREFERGMESALLEQADARETVFTLDRWMELYQDGDPAAPGVLIAAISPGLLRFFGSEPVSREQADDLLQDTWLRIHRVRHSYQPGEAGSSQNPPGPGLPPFETLITGLPESQREVVTMLKVSGLSLEEVARATSSTVGAVKQKAHRAYSRLRALLQPGGKYSL